MKKYLLGSFAIVLAVGFSAFTTKTVKFTDAWFEYVGAQTIEARQQASNYNYVGASEPSCGIGSSECAVQMTNVLGTPSHPDFTNVTFDASGKPQVNSGNVIENLTKN